MIRREMIVAESMYGIVNESYMQASFRKKKKSPNFCSFFYKKKNQLIVRRTTKTTPMTLGLVEGAPAMLFNDRRHMGEGARNLKIPTGRRRAAGTLARQLSTHVLRTTHS